MMNILQFKLGGEYEYNVAFKTGFEKRKIQTNDEPTGNLLESVSAVVSTAVKFFRFENISAKFRQITFSYPDSGPDTFVLELTVKTKENIYVAHTLKTEKIPLIDEDTESTDVRWQIRSEENNILIEKIVNMREEIILYVQGARAQLDLPLEDREDGDESEYSDILLEDELSNLSFSADNITQFPNQKGEK